MLDPSFQQFLLYVESASIAICVAEFTFGAPETNAFTRNESMQLALERARDFVTEKRKKN